LWIFGDNPLWILISQAAVGVDLRASKMKSKAWFYILPKDAMVDSLLMDCRECNQLLIFHQSQHLSSSGGVTLTENHL